VRLLGAPEIDLRHAETPDLPASSDMIPLHRCARGIVHLPTDGRIEIDLAVRQERDVFSRSELVDTNFNTVK
jgi:hypothetical protein